MTKKQERIVGALKTLQRDAPELYDGLINGDCPHSAGLNEARKKDCGYNEPGAAFVMGYCEECWRLAMGGEP